MPFRTKMLILLVLVVTLLAGCGSGPQSNGFGITGKVIVSSSGMGLAGVTLSISQHGSAVTDSNGRFSKTGLTGSVTITPAKTGWTFQPTSITVTGARSDLEFTATGSDVKVRGTIKDTSGTPMAGAQVTVGNKSTTTQPLGDGSFELTVPAGPAKLTINKSGFATYSEQLVLDPPGPVDVGIIRISQDTPPAYGGTYQDPNVIVPAFTNGFSAFDLPTPSATNVGWVAVFPQTQTEGNYSYTFNSQPSAFSTGAKGGATLSPIGGGTRVNTHRVSVNHEFDAFLRLSDTSFMKYRSELLKRARSRQLVPNKLIVGDVRVFNKFDQNDNIVPVTATLKAVGTNALIYVDNANPVEQWIVDDFRFTFDSYSPTLRSTFGNELDVDGNGKVIILLTPLPSTTGTLYGYFWSGNEFPASWVAGSNEADMIYVNPITSQLSTIHGTLAHEYQHYLHWSGRISNGTATSDVWLNEGFSMLAMDLAGYGYDDRNPVATSMVNAWLYSTWTWSLTNWGQDDASYGGSYMFAKYVYDHYGSSIKVMNESTYGGTKAVNDAIGGTFGEVFRSFVGSLAYLFHRRTSPDERLSFPSQIPIDGTQFRGFIVDSTTGGVVTQTIRPWGVQFHWITGGAPNTRMHINLVTSTSGNYGAIALTGF